MLKPILNKFKDSRTDWRCILILVVLVFIISSGILEYTKYTINEIDFITKFSNVVINKQRRIGKDETANWKIYKNEKYGFKIKYPENNEIRYEKENRVEIHLPFHSGTLLLGKYLFIEIWESSSKPALILTGLLRQKKKSM
jgi:hypothetical protein